MKYTAEMDSGAMMYVPRFIKMDSAIQKLIGGIHRNTETQTAWRSHQPIFIFQNMKSRLN
jgi:hypothetical protein